ncbi:MAG: hypothetical protein OXF25_09875 [Cyanobacteria bacterium MAG CAR3_bin_5]|nr:hypothetical protein [Cyanobacteria bacterium MAG CAR3_bin_5]
MLSFIAAAGGAAVGVKLASKDKRDDEIMKSAFAELDSSIKTLEGKLPKSEATSQEGIQELSRTLESKTNLESKIDMISTSLETIQSDFMELNSSTKELDAKLQECVDSKIHELTNSQNDLANKIDGLDNNLKTISQYIDGENEKALNDLQQELSIRPEKCEDELKEYKDKMKNQLPKASAEEKDRLKDQESSKAIKHFKCPDCLYAAKELLSDSLEILPQAFESATKHKDFNPDKIDQLFDLLRKLGTSFRDEMLKMKESGEGSLRTSQAAESVFGRKYSPQGKKYSIRFAWHDESKKVLIGHCGRHR